MSSARGRSSRNSISPTGRTISANTRTGQSSTRTRSCAGGYDARYRVTETALARPWGGAGVIDRLRSGEAAIIVLLAVVLAIVLPPFLFLLRASLTLGTDAAPRYGLDNFVSVIASAGAELWITTLVYALGSSALAITLGVTSAWLVARTDAPF